MVSAWWWALTLALTAGDPAGATVVDSTAFDGWRAEDALDDDGDEAAFVRAADTAVGDEGAVGGEGAPGLALRTRGELLFERAGGRRLRASLASRGARAEALLAREAGETRPIDDAYASLLVSVTPWLRLRAGWMEPRWGAGLVLGPRRVTGGAPAPGPSGSPEAFSAPLAALPARVAAGQRGLAVEFARGALRLGALAAWTPREARPSGGALRPLLGTRHRDDDEEARRGRLRERTWAVGAEAAPRRRGWRAWAVALLVRTDPRRAPYDGSSAAAESAAAIVTGGPAVEAGAAWRAPDGSAALEGALGLDSGGRSRGRLVATARAASGRAALVVESEARGFVPPRALPDRRPRLRAGLRLEPAAPLPIALEAHAVERGPLERPRLAIALAVAPRPGFRLMARHDGEPRATRLAVRLEPAGTGAGGGAGAGAGAGALAPRFGAETRFDRAGLARRTAWVAGGARLPAGFLLAVEARLAGGRSGVVWLDDDVSGGRLVRPGPAAARTRFELRRRGALAPRLSWARTTSPEGRSDELRLALHWDAGSTARPTDDVDARSAPP